MWECDGFLAITFKFDRCGKLIFRETLGFRYCSIHLEKYHKDGYFSAFTQLFDCNQVEVGMIIQQGIKVSKQSLGSRVSGFRNNSHRVEVLLAPNYKPWQNQRWCHF